MQDHKPAIYVGRGGERSFSGLELAELASDVLGRGRRFRFRSRGHSMSPVIKDGDVVTLSPLVGASPGTGEVVAFIRPESGCLVLHRVVARCGDAYIIAGDGTPGLRDAVAGSSVLGRVVRVDRNGRRVIFGLGLERFPIAFLARRGLFLPLLVFISRLLPPAVKRLAV